MNTLPQRFHDKYTVDAETGCWIWTAAKNRHGYGKFRLDGRMQYAHRVSFAAVNGPIPDGKVIDHTCNVRACVNPAHLHAVSQTENVRYAIERDGTHNGARTHCPRGHALTADNLVAAQLARGQRMCLTCNRERAALQAAVASALGKAWGIGVMAARRDPRVREIVRKAWNGRPASDAEAEELADVLADVLAAAVYTPPTA